MPDNLTAYEGVEDLRRFDDASLKAYCDAKLRSCDKHVSFIRERFSSRPIRVLEIGSGSGKLLYRLEQEGMLQAGVGFEVSKSRCIFAARFAEAFGFNRSRIVNENFLNHSDETDTFDLIIGIDVVANLIAPLSPTSLDALLASIRRNLAPGGIGVLELMTLERETSLIASSEQKIYRTWKAFPPSDPFELGLDEMLLDEHKNIVWRKLFIARTGEQSRFDNVLAPLPRSFFSGRAATQGFNIDLFDTWAPGDDTSDQEYIALLTPR